MQAVTYQISGQAEPMESLHSVSDRNCEVNINLVAHSWEITGQKENGSHRAGTDHL